MTWYSDQGVLKRLDDIFIELQKARELGLASEILFNPDGQTDQRLAWADSVFGRQVREMMTG